MADVIRNIDHSNLQRKAFFMFRHGTMEEQKRLLLIKIHLAKKHALKTLVAWKGFTEYQKKLRWTSRVVKSTHSLITENKVFRYWFSALTASLKVNL